MGAASTNKYPTQLLCTVDCRQLHLAEFLDSIKNGTENLVQ